MAAGSLQLLSDSEEVAGRLGFSLRRECVPSMGIIQTIKEEIDIIRDRDPAMHSPLEVFLYPSFWAILSYRRAHRQYLKGHYVRARWISQKSAKKTRIEIHPGAQIGKGLFIDHGTGVVIGETTIIGDNCTLYQGVTLGGTGKEQGKRHPTLGNNVMVGAGAKILGSFTIGDNCRIAAGSVVLQAVPANCTVVGIPGRIVKTFHPGKGLDGGDLDQIHFPDPVKIDIECLNRGQTALTNQFISMEDTLREERSQIRKLKEQNEQLKEQNEQLQEKLNVVQNELEEIKKTGQQEDPAEDSSTEREGHGNSDL